MVGSAYGLTAACGFLAGAGFTLYLGRVVDTVGYVPVFTLVGFMHLIGTAILVVGIRPSKAVVVPVAITVRASDIPQGAAS
jgi:sugar phosphate permease